MRNSFIIYNEYFGQFTLDNLITRKKSMSKSEWKNWIYSLHEYELNCIACVLTFDDIIRERYEQIRLSKVAANKQF